MHVENSGSYVLGVCTVAVRYVRHKLIAALNLFGQNITIKVNLSPVLKATGAAQWTTRIDLRDMNVWLQPVFVKREGKKPACT